MGDDFDRWCEALRRAEETGVTVLFRPLQEQKTEPIKCNMPFDRLPQCACDPGSGDPPTKQQMLECKISGGPCRDLKIS